MKVALTRSDVFTVTAKSRELSALVAAARMALEMMRHDPDAPPDAIELLSRVLRDYDAAIARLKTTGGRSSRPPGDSLGAD